MVPLAFRSKGHHRELATALQRSTAAFEPRLSHAERVRGSTNKHSASSCNGQGRCGDVASAPQPVAPPAPRGANAASNGRRLKLTVVRRIWAGQAFTPDWPMI